VQATNALNDANCASVDGSNLTPGVSSQTVVIPNKKRLFLPCGTFTGGATVNPVIQVTSFGEFWGRDRNCTIISTNSGTANIIAAGNGENWWRISDLAVLSAVARTAGAGIRVQGGHGVIERVVVYPVFDGVTFDTAGASGNNVIRDSELTSGTGSPGTPGSGNAWHCGFKNGGVASGTVSGNVADNVTISPAIAFTDAAFCIQDGSDTISIVNSQVASSGGDSVGLHLETVNGGAAPANTTITTSAFEGGVTQNAIVHDAGWNTKFVGVTAQSSLRGLVVNGGSNIEWVGGTFHLNQREGLQINSSSDVKIVGSHFSDDSQATTNTYDDIFVAANVSNFSLIGNNHKDLTSTGKVCKYGVEIASGTSDYYSVLADTNNGNCVGGQIVDGGSGTHKNMCNPGSGSGSGPLCYLNGTVVTQLASTLQKSESGADTNVLTFTPPGVAGTYRIRLALSLSAANAATLGWTATWKDSSGNAQAPTNLAFFQSGIAAPALTFTTSAARDYYADAQIDVDSSATNIVIKLTFSGTSFTGKASASVERVQ
jgi:hypothetical protein